MENHERKTRNGKSGSGKTKLTVLTVLIMERMERRLTSLENRVIDDLHDLNFRRSFRTPWRWSRACCVTAEW